MLTLDESEIVLLIIIDKIEFREVLHVLLH